MASAELLKYAPFVSTPEVSFFQELAHRKLNNWGLETKSVPLRGTYSYARAGDPPRFSVNNSSFDVAPTDSTEAFTDVTAPGELLNVNTSGDFKALDKNALLQSLGDRLLGDIASGAAEIDPSALSRFVVLSFADLKTHAYLYWFAFPALTCPATVLAHQPLVNVLPSMETRNDLRTGLTALRAQDASKGHLGCPPFFVIVPPPPSAPPSSDSGSTTVACPLKVLPLSSYATLPEDERQWSMFGFVDCCGLEGIPGWPLRNFMIMLAKRWGLTRAKVVCYRTVLRRLDLEGPVLSTSETNGDPYAIASANNEDQQSFVLELELQPVQEVAADHSQLPQAPPASSPTSPPPASSSPLVTRATAVLGWEANSRGKAGPKSMNLSSLMDPQRMMESAADLNLRLMKWRALPQLNTSMLAATKVLCLGAGTLGCQVARTLLGWGIKHINFVDNGRVSFSNPTRQCLFEFADCLNGGKPKAQAAAAALHRIFPSVTSQGYGLSIPMPGHALAEAEVASAAAATAQLEALILEHDVVFLLTDTRESRWLPTLLCATHDKMLINVALGMDSYLVCRHGPAPTLPSSISGIEDSAAAAEDEDVAAGTSATANRLGCYFCNDAVAVRVRTHYIRAHLAFLPFSFLRIRLCTRQCSPCFLASVSLAHLPPSHMPSWIIFRHKCPFVCLV